MENTEQNNTSVAVPQPLNVFHAGLSVLCPGLGQFWQAGFFFLQLHPARFAVSCWYFILWAFAIEILFSFPHHKDLDAESVPFGLIIIFVVSGCLLYLSIALLTLFSVLDAATWKPGKPMLFKKPLIVLTILLVPLILFLFVGVPAIGDAREAARRMLCSGRTNQLTLAFLLYHEQHGHFPPAYTVDENGNPLHSWRVLILPYMEQGKLYEQIRLDEPWDSEHNRRFHNIQLGIFQCPSRNRNVWGLRYNCDYSVIIGTDTVFPGAKVVSLDDIATPSDTILFVERMVPVNWMDPNHEIRFDAASEGINRHPFGIGSEHSRGVNAGFAEGGYRFLIQTADGRIHSYGRISIDNIKSLLTKSAEDE